jgi:hypothetical protein
VFASVQRCILSPCQAIAPTNGLLDKRRTGGSFCGALNPACPVRSLVHFELFNEFDQLLEAGRAIFNMRIFSL